MVLTVLIQWIWIAATAVPIRLKGQKSGPTTRVVKFIGDGEQLE